MSIRYDLPKGQFFDKEGRYVNPATVAEKLVQAEAALEEAITYTIKYGPYQGSSRETVWADLRARAEEGRK